MNTSLQLQQGRLHHCTQRRSGCLTSLPQQFPALHVRCARINSSKTPGESFTISSSGNVPSNAAGTVPPTRPSSSGALPSLRCTLELAQAATFDLLKSPCSLIVLAALMVHLMPVEPAAAADVHSSIQSTPSSMADLAEGEEFWANVAKYGRYFVTVMLGTGYVMVKPVLEAFKRPVTAIAAVVGIGGGIVLLKITLDAMLGIQEPFAYEPGNIVPYS